MIKSKSKGNGFTLIEMLVSILIIGVLALLIIPAVQSSRESARRALCLSRMKQISAAIANFESSNRHLPTLLTGFVIDSRHWFGNTTLSLHYQILPFLEQSVLFNSVNYQPNDKNSFFYNSAPNRTALNTRVENFLCPSDTPFGSPNNNYRANLGSEPFSSEDTENIGVHGGGGPFRIVLNTTYSDVKDGLSRTAGVSERVVGNGNKDKFIRSRDFWYSNIGSMNPRMTSDRLSEICGLAPPRPLGIHSRFGAYWLSGYRSFTIYDHVLPPNSQSPDCTSGSFSNSLETYTTAAIAARSYHVGGVHIGFMDGSVRFISDSININTWRALGTRNGDEQMTEF